jgi:hypothetical protein
MVFILKVQKINNIHKSEIIKTNNNIYEEYFKYVKYNIDEFRASEDIFNNPKYILSDSNKYEDYMKDNYYMYIINNDLNFNFEVFHNFDTSDKPELLELSSKYTLKLNKIFNLDNEELESNRGYNIFLKVFKFKESDNDIKKRLIMSIFEQ